MLTENGNWKRDVTPQTKEQDTKNQHGEENREISISNAIAFPVESVGPRTTERRNSNLGP